MESKPSFIFNSLVVSTNEYKRNEWVLEIYFYVYLSKFIPARFHFYIINFYSFAQEITYSHEQIFIENSNGSLSNLAQTMVEIISSIVD